MSGGSVWSTWVVTIPWQPRHRGPSHFCELCLHSSTRFDIKILKKIPLGFWYGEGKTETFWNIPKQSVFTNKAFCQEKQFCQSIIYWGFISLTYLREGKYPTPALSFWHERKEISNAISLYPSTSGKGHTHEISNSVRAGVAILIYYKIDFTIRNSTKEWNTYFVMIKSISSSGKYNSCNHLHA